MNEGKIQESVTWLGELLAGHRSHLSNILLRLRDIGARAGTSRALHRKFLNLMDQVALEQKKELGLICDIEAMEKRHAMMRKQRLLRQADDAVPESKPELVPLDQNQPDEKPVRSGLLKLFALFVLFSNNSIKHKNQ